MNKNQNGFAILEIILVLGIIALFSTVAVPKMARLVDKANLNYEMKHLYSDLNFARDINRSIGYIPTEIGDGNYVKERVKFRISYKSNRTEIRCTRDGKSDFVLHQHNLSDGITFSGSLKEIKDLSFSDSYTVNLNSKFGDKAYVKIDSVGRIRGTYEK